MMSTLSLGWLGEVGEKRWLTNWTKTLNLYAVGRNSVPVLLSLLPITLNVQSYNCWSANNGCKGQTFCNSRPHYRTAIMEPLTLFLVQHFKWIIRLRSRFLSHLDNFATQIHVFIWQPLVSDKVMLHGVSFHAMVLPLNTWPVTSKCKDQSWKCSHTALTELAKHLWQHDFEGRTRRINSQHAIFYST